MLDWGKRQLRLQAREPATDCRMPSGEPCDHPVVFHGTPLASYLKTTDVDHFFKLESFPATLRRKPFVEPRPVHASYVAERAEYLLKQVYALLNDSFVAVKTPVSHGFPFFQSVFFYSICVIFCLCVACAYASTPFVRFNPFSLFFCVAVLCVTCLMAFLERGFLLQLTSMCCTLNNALQILAEIACWTHDLEAAGRCCALPSSFPFDAFTAEIERIVEILCSATGSDLGPNTPEFSTENAAVFAQSQYVSRRRRALDVLAVTYIRGCAGKLAYFATVDDRRSCYLLIPSCCYTCFVGYRYYFLLLTLTLCSIPKLKWQLIYRTHRLRCLLLEQWSMRAVKPNIPKELQVSRPCPSVLTRRRLELTQLPASYSVGARSWKTSSFQRLLWLPSNNRINDKIQEAWKRCRAPLHHASIGLGAALAKLRLSSSLRDALHSVCATQTVPSNCLRSQVLAVLSSLLTDLRQDVLPSLEEAYALLAATSATPVEKKTDLVAPAIKRQATRSNSVASAIETRRNSFDDTKNYMYTAVAGSANPKTQRRSVSPVTQRGNTAALRELQAILSQSAGSVCLTSVHQPFVIRTVESEGAEPKTVHRFSLDDDAASDDAARDGLQPMEFCPNSTSGVIRSTEVKTTNVSSTVNCDLLKVLTQQVAAKARSMRKCKTQRPNCRLRRTPLTRTRRVWRTSMFGS